jgi:hypothetical protein
MTPIYEVCRSIDGNGVDRGRMNGLAWGSGTSTDTELGSITSETGTVVVAAWRTGNGMRLKLASGRTGRSVLLDATVLDALCSLTPEQVRRTIERGNPTDRSAR